MPNSGEIKPHEQDAAGSIHQATDHAILDAARYIAAGHLVAFPTETVYGLGADASNSMAVAQIFDAKERPRFNPLIVHVANLSAARRYGEFSPSAIELANAFWPGPLTLVVHRRAGSTDEPAVCDLASAGLPTLAIRVPAHPVAQALLRSSGRPLAAPSANRSGHVSATLARHVADDLANRVAMILDGGATLHGIESTILDVTGHQARLLRPGAISRDQLEHIVKQPIEMSNGVSTERPSAPGQLQSHYAPRALLRLNATTCAPDEALLAFGMILPPTSGPVFNLSPSGDVIEAAARLFAALRQLDDTGVASIAVMTIPMHGLGEAINDRLRRAAAPRR